MGNFTDMAKTLSNTKYTENGAIAYQSTNGGTLLDLFGTIGGMRGRIDDVIIKWHAARKEDKELADNLVLYARNIRGGGLGERSIGRALLRELAMTDPRKVERNFQTVVDCGRWDDLFIFIDTPVEDAMWDFILAQLGKDTQDMMMGKPISLLAKWMKSINTSSTESRRIARLTAKHLGLNEKEYRKVLAKLRAHIKVLETQMSADRWEDINFSAVPSKAMVNYAHAFNRHVGEKFAQYKEDVANGKEKVNAATLYPYDIIQPYLANHRSYYNTWDSIYDEQWKALPNYLDGEKSVVFVVDTSGSMCCNNYLPISTAIGLGIYFAQRNKGAYHNLFMTFSTNPAICYLNDEWSLKESVDYVLKRDWGGSTDLDKTYSMIFDIAMRTQDAPAAICVVSDMEVNSWNYNGNDYMYSITDKWKAKFEDAGLVMPKLIYWNVNARQDTFLANANDNVSFVSGSGIGPFKNFTTLIDKSAYQAMVDILTQKEFSWR